jgi:hypothetical protein
VYNPLMDMMLYLFSIVITSLVAIMLKNNPTKTVMDIE